MTDHSNEDDDYIYRGGPATPQDGEPWNPPIPPPSGQPTRTPEPTGPPPAFPPHTPPTGEPFASTTTPAKKKRWPWIVAASILFCGLPLGACVGLVAFGAVASLGGGRARGRGKHLFLVFLVGT